MSVIGHANDSSLPEYAAVSIWAGIRVYITGSESILQCVRFFMDKEDIEYRKQIVNTYKPDVQKLIRYLPWLEEKAGSSVQETFDGSGIRESSITFPVYDGTLMNFIREVQRTGLLDRNYPYIYSRLRIRTVKDELKAIEHADIREMDVLKGIMSKYVLGGMTKGRLWGEAVHNRIFLNIVRKMKANLEFWDRPMD